MVALTSRGSAACPTTRRGVPTRSAEGTTRSTSSRRATSSESPRRTSARAWRGRCAVSARSARNASTTPSLWRRGTASGAASTSWSASASCASAAPRRPDPAARRRAAASQGRSVQKGEYATVPLLVHATKQILDNWGDDGWELVQVVPGPGGGEQLVAYLKRPKA